MGQFIVVEGIDGSGKTTFSKHLAIALMAANKTVYSTREPSAGPLGRVIRSILAKETTVSYKSMPFLFTADRVDHQDEINDALASNDYVICDRYYHSTLVYQQKYVSDIKTMHALANIKIPDITFIIDVAVDVALQRLSSRTVKELYETRDRLEQASNGYKDLKNTLPNECIYIINGMNDLDSLTQLALSLLNEQLPPKNLQVG